MRKALDQQSLLLLGWSYPHKGQSATFASCRPVSAGGGPASSPLQRAALGKLD